MIAITVLIMLEDIVVKQNRNYKIIAFIKDINNVCKLPFKRRKFFCVIGNFVHITQKRSAGMRTAAYNADVASDRRRRENAVLNGTRKTLLFRKYIYEIFRFIYFGKHADNFVKIAQNAAIYKLHKWVTL